MNIPATVFNPRLFAALGDNNAKTKLAQQGQAWIRDKIQEESFTTKIIPKEPIAPADIQVSTEHDHPLVIIPLEPETRAVTMSFRGAPDVKMISAPRIAAAFVVVSSEMYEKPQQELIVYQKTNTPVTKLIEDSTVYTIQAIEDREMTMHSESCVQAMQSEANGGGAVPALFGSSIVGGTGPVEYSVRKSELARVDIADTTYSWPFQLSDKVSLVRMIDARRLRTETMLITEPDFDTWVQMPAQDLGDGLKSETAASGYTKNELGGLKYVRTNKTDIVRPGNVYGFTAAEFLGKYYRLEDTQFYIDRIAQMVKWQSWESVSLTLVNVQSICKLELYSADATVNDTQTVRTSLIPLEEAQITPTNNRVASGVWYPRVVSY